MRPLMRRNTALMPSNLAMRSLVVEVQRNRENQRREKRIREDDWEKAEEPVAENRTH